MLREHRNEKSVYRELGSLQPAWLAKDPCSVNTKFNRDGMNDCAIRKFCGCLFFALAFCSLNLAGGYNPSGGGQGNFTSGAYLIKPKTSQGDTRAFNRDSRGL